MYAMIYDRFSESYKSAVSIQLYQSKGSTLGC